MATRGIMVLATALCVMGGPPVTADAMNLSCGVRCATSPVEQRRAFDPPARDKALEDGFVATAAVNEVTGGQRVDVTVADSTGAEREVVIDVCIKLEGDWSHLFVTDGYGPRLLDGAGGTTYRSRCSLPAVTLYNTEAGVTVAAAFEVPAPTLTFSWEETPQAAAITGTISHLRLPAGGKARASLLIGQHEGCWRPGLGWLVDLYPEYFEPPNPKVWDYDGPMIYDFVTSESRLRRDLGQDLTWQELGWYWPHLGLYLPKGESWSRQPRSEGGLGEGGTVTRAALNEYIDLTSRLGIAQCLYFQSTESWAEFAEENFPECRYGLANGALVPTWVKCVVMNPDPEGRFGQHIQDQLRSLVTAFPGMAGVFWDQNCYTGFDFAHDDGVSMVNGRRVSMLELPQERLLARGGKFLHDHGKVIFTNGGWTVGLARHCDGHMSEGTGPTRRLQYICMNKHLTLLAYDNSLQRCREKLELALETGAQPAVTLGDDSCRALYENYKPIFRLLRRKSWVFHPRALTLPNGIAGNVFRNPAGNYVVTAIADRQHPVPPVERDEPVLVAVRVPQADEIPCVFEMNPQRRGLLAVEVSKAEGGYDITIPRPEAGTALLLPRRGQWVGSGTPRLIAGRTQPVAIAVANLTPESWAGEWRFAVGGEDIVRALELAPFQVERVELGSVSVGRDETVVSVKVTGPMTRDEVGESVIDIPVVSPISLHVPMEELVQARRGETLAYAIANRLPEEMTVTIRTHWEGAVQASEPMRVTLERGQATALRVEVDPPRAGPSELRIEVGWPGGTLARPVRVEVFEAVLPRDFNLADVAGLSLRMDIFNSLGGRWADKPVTINGRLIGPLPITGTTLRWHKAAVLEVPEGRARDMLKAGLGDDGHIELAVAVGNEVKNCFKVRNVQATVATRLGAKVLSSQAPGVYCSDPGWLYSEGECVRLGTPVRVGPLRLTREN